jgi:excinuclease UvrABC nuclease subunit
MPAAKRWMDFNEDNIKQLPNLYGVYQFANDKKEIIYIGDGKLKHNISSYFSDKDASESIVYFRYRENDSKKSSKQRKNILLKDYKEKNGKIPEFN